MAKILLIEDDEVWCQSIRDALLPDNIQCEYVDNGFDALDRLKFYHFDLVIIDWGLPGISGVDVLRQYRDVGGKVPVLMLTAMGSIENKECGLDTGADDYLTKPFDVRELRARVRALLRRPGAFQDSRLQFCNLVLEPNSLSVSVAGKALALLPGEYQLLQFLMRYPEQIFAAEALLNRVWSSESDATEEALKSCIKRLRKKIEVPESDCVIQNVYGLGYKLARNAVSKAEDQ